MGAKRFLALAGLVLLTSCSYLADTEGLLYPPTLNRQQAEVYAALEDTLNTANVVYKYPQRGDYRSPFIFYDMNGDGKDEAIVFYSYLNEPGSTRAKVLWQDKSNRWESFYDFSSDYGQVDFVKFACLLTAESASMIIGWKQAENQGTGQAANSVLAVYSLLGDNFTCEIRQQSYIDYTIRDFDGDALEELVVMERAKDQGLSLTLLRAVGRHLDAVESLPLCSEADAMLQMTTGRLWDGSAAVYIDELRIDTSVATEVVQVGSSGMTVLAGGEPPAIGSDEELPAWENYTYTFRDDPGQLSRDIDRDGVIEVPAAPVALPGNLYEGQDLPLTITQLMRLSATGFTIWKNTVINEQEGYVVALPEKWWDRVSVSQDNEAGEWRFFLIDPSSGNATTELLRIQAYYTQSGLAAPEDSIPLGSRGTRQYTGYIPLPAADVPSITERELKNMFYLL